MANPTLLDIAIANGSDAVVGLVDEASKVHPELTLGAARTIKGTDYKTLVRTAVPAVGFRNANEGTAATKGTYENRRVETFIMNPVWEADRAVANAYEDGWQAYLAMEASGMMEGSFQTVCKQMYYGPGTGGDAKGFPGLIQAYDSTNMVVDAGGTTANTGSSLWAIKFGPKHCQWVWGQNGSLAMDDVTEVRLTDGSSNPYMAYHQELLAYPGFQVASVYSCGRIKKLTADSGKGLTDALVFSLFAKFPAGMMPDILLCTRRSQEQLRSSRTATNATGAPAPTPTEVGGVPLLVTESILDTEALTL